MEEDRGTISESRFIFLPANEMVGQCLGPGIRRDLGDIHDPVRSRYLSLRCCFLSHDEEVSPLLDLQLPHHIRHEGQGSQDSLLLLLLALEYLKRGGDECHPPLKGKGKPVTVHEVIPERVIQQKEKQQADCSLSYPVLATEDPSRALHDPVDDEAKKPDL